MIVQSGHNVEMVLGIMEEYINNVAVNFLASFADDRFNDLLEQQNKTFRS